MPKLDDIVCFEKFRQYIYEGGDYVGDTLTLTKAHNDIQIEHEFEPGRLSVLSIKPDGTWRTYVATEF